MTGRRGPGRHAGRAGGPAGGRGCRDPAVRRPGRPPRRRLAIALLYLDTSALAKLVVAERETDALRAFLAEREHGRLVSSALVRAELPRAVLRFGHRAGVTPEQAQAAAQSAAALLRRVDLVRVGAAVLDRAGRQPPGQLRSLDAIHLATALGLGFQLKAMVTTTSASPMPRATPG